jgi:chitinase
MSKYGLFQLSRTCPGSFASCIGVAAWLALVPMHNASAQQASPCADEWSAASTYTAGSTASQDKVNYKANWWTQGEAPRSSHGPVGSGRPWTSLGMCTDDGGEGPNPPPEPPPRPSGLLFSPYKDVTINLDWNTNMMRTGATGNIVPVVGPGSLLANHQPNLGAITLAFATGECGNENWGGISAASFANVNIAALDRAGLDYIVSTGGAAGAFTCSSTAGMASFLRRYMTPHMVGLDFDIEAGQSLDQINALVRSAKYAEDMYPDLRLSFTLATLAASDGSQASVNAKGDAVIRAVLASGLRNYTINLMVMDYGSQASPSICVVSNGLCDMGRSAIQAARNVKSVYGIPFAKQELTPMIAVNDVASEVFSPADVDTVVAFALSEGLGGLHHWSLDRDTPCRDGQSTASPICNSLPGTSSLEYTRRFLRQLGR